MVDCRDREATNCRNSVLTKQVGYFALSVNFHVGDDNAGVVPPIKDVIATSSNPALVSFDPTSVSTPATGSRRLAIIPNPNQFGTAIILVTVTTLNGQNAKDTF